MALEPKNRWAMGKMCCFSRGFPVYFSWISSVLKNSPLMTRIANTDAIEGMRNQRGSAGKQAIGAMPTICPLYASLSHDQKPNRAERGSRKNPFVLFPAMLARFIPFCFFLVIQRPHIKI